MINKELIDKVNEKFYPLKAQVEYLHINPCIFVYMVDVEGNIVFENYTTDFSVNVPIETIKEQMKGAVEEVLRGYLRGEYYNH